MAQWIPRDHMPQVDEADLPQLVALAYVAGLSPCFDVVSPNALRAHQRADHKRAATIPPMLLRKPLLVSVDGYVLDGNHRRMGNMMHKQPCNVIRIGLPFDKAIAWLFTLPFTYKLTKAPNGATTVTPIRN